MDETRPLLGYIDQYPHRVAEQSVDDFDPDGDPDNPMDWSPAYKAGIVFLLAFMAFTV